METDIHMTIEKMVEKYSHPHAADAVNAYRTFANLNEEFEVTNESIDEWALTEAAVRYGVQKQDLRHMLLGEDLTLEDSLREREGKQEEVKTKTEIEQELDRNLVIARRMSRRGATSGFPAVLFEGESGVGKTSIVSQWAKDNGLNFFSYDVRNASPESLQGVIANHPDHKEFVIRKISTELLMPLSRPNTIMFIDEYNRGKVQVRNALLDLIISHKMIVPMVGSFEESKKTYEPYGELQEDGYLFFPNLLFVVAAQNPYKHTYAGTQELDAAEVDRFSIKKIDANNEHVLAYLVKKYTKDMELDREAGDEEGALESEGRIALAKKLLTSPDFYFDTADEREKLYDENPSNKYLGPRSLEFLLTKCDGTKDDFIKRWNDYCNYKKKTAVETILSDYVDVQDKANDAIKEPTKSDVFSNRESVGAMLRRKLAEQ